jgi:predicted ferric reductase
MENKNQPITFVFWIVAIILGVTLYKQFDFKNLKFENPAMAVIYGIVFLFSVYYIIKNSKKQPK